MNKKAFTLIELLAVIIIIGLLAVIVIPKLQNTLKDSKKKTYEVSAHALEREANNFYLTERFDKSSFEGCTYNFTTNSNSCTGFEFTGDKPEGGELKISSKGYTSYALKFGDYCYLNYGQSEIVIEDYNEQTCKIAEPNSFETDSWQTILYAIKSNNTSNYNLGDTKEIELEGFGTKTLRIVNKSTPEECNSQGFSQTACGFVIEFEEPVTAHRMNPYVLNSTELGNGSIGGWEYSEGRQYINNEIYNSLPSYIRNSIINTYVISTSISGTHKTTDKLYLPAYEEMDKTTNVNYTKTLDYYLYENLSDSEKKEQSYLDATTKQQIFSRDGSRYDDSFCGIIGFSIIEVTGRYGSFVEYIRSGAQNEIDMTPLFRL